MSVREEGVGRVGATHSMEGMAKTLITSVVLNVPNGVIPRKSSSYCGDPSHKIISLACHKYNFTRVL